MDLFGRLETQRKSQQMMLYIYICITLRNWDILTAVLNIANLVLTIQKY